ncbi:transcriptional regulator family: Fungal Specific TF [Penicillium roqueforti]|nr:transcriptional regulator family: Fungal Specific TF [Penicillium roqueforti]KAI3142229.1 transcriptional regulator family: Fungal Specific TF [Penicillium roqueforti]KAI3177080.1 transcriptional regulator family: Fungal Specific TF [Penicillium roqueforti]KAI3237138.1 transcriptional regulator family: Fungal Specific TF [Penicillium roqueforti]KAI3263178.1 transcriptional regulator family: Fungal Specific TF [Penicillium roqueforti]
MHSYVATLESRIQILESQLRVSQSHQATSRNGVCLTPETTFFESQTPETGIPALIQQDGRESHRDPRSLALASAQPPNSESPEIFAKPIQVPGPTTDVTMLEMVYGREYVAEPDVDTLPPLPSSSGAKKLVDAAYFYTQARYCIVDWTQLGIWHQQREEIAQVSPQSPVESQTGAFFIWIAYFARARTYLPAVMALQDMATIQALLCLVQYYFRAQTESPIWHLVGLALRLCVKLRYHRKLGDSPEAKGLGPYTIELRKRFFWCAYCFDRSLAIWSKLPFGISDSDIDAEIPIDMDDTCTDDHRISQMQLNANTMTKEHEDRSITTMTAALHHLHVYRIRTRYTGPNAKTPSLAEVQEILYELEQWKQQAPDEKYSKRFPQQSPDRVQATYTQAVLLLIRPILMAKEIHPDLIGLCVEFAVEACSNAKTLSLNPHTPPDRITVYHCFYCGVTLLQCLAISPTALTARRTHQAISACLSALAVYTRVLPAIAPFLRLFEDLSNLLVYDDNSSDTPPSPEVRNVLNRIVSSDPSEASGILHSLSGRKSREVPIPETLAAETMLAQPTQYDSILGGQSSVAFGADFSLEMPLDISPLYAPDIEVPELWTAPWLPLSTTQYL